MKHYYLYFILIVLFGCSNAGDQQSDYFESKENVGYRNPAADSAIGFTPAGYQQDPIPSAQPKAIIRKANLELEVKDFKQFSKNIHSLIKKYEGWIAEENIRTNKYNQENVMDIRIPSEQLDDFLEAIAQTDAIINVSSIAAEDVTSKLIDTKGRIEAKVRIRTRYIELLKQAKSMSDVLELQREINSITEDMEVAAYTLSHLQEEVAYSSVHCTYSEHFDYATNQPGLLSRAGTALADGADGFLDLVIMMLRIWPLWILSLMTIVLFRQRRKKRRIMTNPNK